MTKRYERKNKKPYQEWVLNHKDEIIALPNNGRTDYVMNKLKDELNIEMKRSNVYQLLYRNGMINHKLDFIKQKPVEPVIIETTDTTTDTEPDVDSNLEPEYSNDSFRNGICHFLSPDLLEKITFIENSDDCIDSDSEDW